MLVTQLTQTLALGNPDVVGVLVVDADGKVRASDATSSELVRAAVAMVVPLRDLLDRAAAELGCGEVVATLIEGREASLAIADIDGFRTVVVVGASGAAPGALRADAVWLAEQARKERTLS